MKKNWIDKTVDFFCKMKIFNPLSKVYYNHREVWLYLFFGVLTVVVNVITYVLFANFIKMDYMVANIIAWIIAVIFAYITNKKFVFESKKNTIKELVKETTSFFLARLFSLGIDVLIMYIGVTILSQEDIFIKIIANIVVIIANYFMSKIFIFKKEDNNGKK